MMETPFIEQVMVLGANRKFTAALIVPALGTLQQWALQQGIADTTAEALISHPLVIAHYQTLVDEYNDLFNQVEKVKRFALLPDSWSIEGGELTPKLSLRRAAIMEKYNKVIAQLYE
jgi:long-chain acyl-CoA synthetase